MKNIIELGNGKFLQTVTINKKEDEDIAKYEKSIKYLAKISCYGILALIIFSLINRWVTINKSILVIIEYSYLFFY